MTETPKSTSCPDSPIAILGVPFDKVTTQETLGEIEAMIRSGRPHYLVTANVDFVVQARNDVELRRILFDAHLVLADGMPLVWASRWLGNPLPERVTGSGMTPLLLARAEAKGWGVFLLGGTEQSVAQAAANVRLKHPRLRLVGAYSPPFKPLIEMDHADILRRLRDARPDILLVAFGCPKQEKWLNMHYRTAGVPVAIGVGATIDFLAGTMKRAPAWMQKTGLEWIFRLLQEPRRLFRRYVTDLWVFGCAIIQQVNQMPATRKASSIAPSLEITSTQDTEVFSIKPPARLTKDTVEANQSLWRELSEQPRDVLFKAGSIETLDSTAIGWLIRLRKVLRENGRHLILIEYNRVLDRAFELMKLSGSFDRVPDVPSAFALLAARRRESNVRASAGRTQTEAAIAWQGEITALNVDKVARATDACLTHVSERLVIDLSAVRFIDSSGIGLMVRLKKQARARNIGLAFVGPSENVRNVARLLRLEDALFNIKP